MNEKNKSLSKGGIYYLIYNVLNLAFPFITGIYVARKLIPSNIGEVAAAQNLAMYFVILAFLGIPTYGLREISKTRDDREQRNKLFSELFVINLISTIIFSIVYLVVVFSIAKYRSNLSLYLIVGISIALNAFNISWLYEGLEEFRFISIRNILFKAISFMCLVILVKEPDDYLKYAVVTVIGTAGNYVVNMVYSPKYATISFRNLNLRRHLKSIIYLVAVNLAIEIYSLMDITMMNFMSSNDSIAFYKYGNNIERMLQQVVNTFTMVLVPRISFYYQEKEQDKFNKLVSKGLKLIILTSIPMIVGIYFTADFLIQQMYGVQYANSATILKMFSLLLLISPIGYLLGSRMLLVTDHENKMVICVGIGAVVNLIGNTLLIPRLHEFGATIASLLSEIVVMVVYVYFGKKYFKLINVPQSAIKALTGAALMAVYLYACSLLNINGWVVLIIQVIGAVAIYGATLLLTNEEITRQYWDILVSKIKR